MKLLLLSLVVCAAMASTDGSDWSTFEGRQFQFIGTPVTWVEAQKHCISLGGSLASVHSKREEEFVQKLAKGRAAWLGLTDAQVDGEWLWMTSKPLDYTNWCRGQPNNWSGRQSCLQINYTAERCWDDNACTRRLPFVCVT